MNGERKSGNPGLRGDGRKEASAGGLDEIGAHGSRFPRSVGQMRRRGGRSGDPASCLNTVSITSPDVAPCGAIRVSAYIWTVPFEGKNVDHFCGHMRGATKAVYYGALPFMMLDGPLPVVSVVPSARSILTAPAASRRGAVRRRRRPGR
jgi:hypothetical protein